MHAIHGRALWVRDDSGQTGRAGLRERVGRKSEKQTQEREPPERAEAGASRMMPPL